MRSSLHDEVLALIKSHEETQSSDGQTKLIDNLMACLKELTVQVREDIPEEQGSVHLWTAVEDAEFLLGFIEMSDDQRDLDLLDPT